VIADICVSPPGTTGHGLADDERCAIAHDATGAAQAIFEGLEGGA
jgi:hypothetical protein